MERPIVLCGRGRMGPLVLVGQAVSNVFALSTSMLTAPILAMTALTGQGLGTFRVEGGWRQVAEVAVGVGLGLRGKTVAEVAAARQAVVLAHLPAKGAPRFLLDVDPDARLVPGDRLVLCAEPRSLAALLA